MNSIIRSFACVVAMSSMAMLGHAQTDQGQIAGTARDASGAVVAGAKITARNEKTNAERTTETNGDGYFLLTNLPPATYTLIGKADGLAIHGELMDPRNI